MIRTGLGNAGRNHVRVADRLDLFESAVFGEVIEAREDGIQQIDDVGDRLRQRGIADDIGEQHTTFAESVGEGTPFPPQALADRRRQHVLEEFLESRVGAGQLPFGLGQIRQKELGHINQRSEAGEEQNPASSPLRLRRVGEAQGRERQQPEFDAHEDRQATAGIQAPRTLAMLEEQ